jgi:anti-sigma regulatory factor (Ser/Thr protein kinase)
MANKTTTSTPTKAQQIRAARQALRHMDRAIELLEKAQETLKKGGVEDYAGSLEHAKQNTTGAYLNVLKRYVALDR